VIEPRVLDQRSQFRRAAPTVAIRASKLQGFSHLDGPPLGTWLDSWAGIGRVAVGMARQGYDIQLTGYDEKGWRAKLLHDLRGTLCDERDRHRMGAHAVACGAEGGVGGAPSHTHRKAPPMIITDLVDLGLALAFAIVAIAVGALLGLRRRWRRGRR
jgi:hypothetical protein